jgi:hypothetical protein
MLALDMRVERLLFPEHFVAGRITGTVELGIMCLSMPFEPCARLEGLVASIPIADKCALDGCVTVGFL